MFCSECGNQLAKGLNFCNRCGAEAQHAKKGRDEVGANLASSLGYIGGFGMAGFFAVLLVMVKNLPNDTAIVWISMFYLATLFGICYMILRQTSPARFTGNRASNAVDDAAEHAYLKPVTTAQLHESTDRPISITEHTTKTLDEVAVPRK